VHISQVPNSDPLFMFCSLFYLVSCLLEALLLSQAFFKTLLLLPYHCTVTVVDVK
jgi:hypothetical protein